MFDRQRKITKSKFFSLRNSLFSYIFCHVKKIMVSVLRVKKGAEHESVGIFWIFPIFSRDLRLSTWGAKSAPSRLHNFFVCKNANSRTDCLFAAKWFASTFERRLQPTKKTWEKQFSRENGKNEDSDGSQSVFSFERNSSIRFKRTSKEQATEDQKTNYTIYFCQ